METNARKLIGYKVPFDLFNGEIKKGSLYKLSTSNKLFYSYSENLSSYFSIPKEIVEKWEKVFEPEEIEIRLEDLGINLIIGKNKIVTKGGMSFSYSQLNTVYTGINAVVGRSYATDIKTQINNLWFTYSELNQIITAYKKLNA